MFGEWIPLLDSHQLPDEPGIYAIRHRESGKEYVGLSKAIRTRVSSHRSAPAWHYFGRALRAHGLAAFDVCVLHLCAAEDLGRLEQETIAARGCRAPAGYNLADGGLGPTGVAWSYERRQAQSLARTGIKPSPEAIEKMRAARLKYNGFKGRKHTAETKAKIGAATVRAHTGLKRSDETKARISASLVGRAAPVLSAEARERVRLANMGPNPKKAQSGEKNGMYGVRGASHPAAKRVAVWFPEGLLPYAIFDTATEAAAWAGVNVTSISDWCSGRYQPKKDWIWCKL